MQLVGARRGGTQCDREVLFFAWGFPATHKYRPIRCMSWPTHATAETRHLPQSLRPNLPRNFFFSVPVPTSGKTTCRRSAKKVFIRNQEKEQQLPQSSTRKTLGQSDFSPSIAHFQDITSARVNIPYRKPNTPPKVTCPSQCCHNAALRPIGPMSSLESLSSRHLEDVDSSQKPFPLLNSIAGNRQTTSIRQGGGGPSRG